MASSEEYRRFAQACLEMAHGAAEEQTRAILVQMAQVWFRLAEEKESGSSSQKNSNRLD
jgi:hypothetical protein